MSNPSSCGLLDNPPLAITVQNSTLRNVEHLFAQLEMNWEQLQELSDGCPKFGVELLRLFISDSGEHLASLHEAIAQQNSLASEQAAHHLKGASANVGVSAMHRIAAQLEEQFRQQKLEGAEELVSQLESLLGDLQRLLGLVLV